MKLHPSYFLPAILAAFVPTSGAPEPRSSNEGSDSSTASPVEGVNARVAAARIDRLVELDLQRAKLTPNAVADDATFLRRSYLGIVGRIPTAAETREFLHSQVQDKRVKLIDTLLDSPGFQSHMFNYWADLLRVKSRLNNQISGEPFMHYLKSSIAENKPYDQLVREMVAASGPAHKRGNGASGMLLRDRGMPLDSMANTVRVFLGTRLECAQCHNHPFDKWTQKDFYQMAAFTGGLNYRVDPQSQEMGNGVRALSQELRRNNDRNGLRALGQMMRGANSGISGSGTGKIRLPKDYKYEDAKPGELIHAQAIFGKSPKIAYPEAPQAKKPGRRLNRRERQAEQRRLAQQRRNRNRNVNAGPELGTREAFAAWLTAADNPRFTRVIANRLWKLVMGRGLIEPVDNLTDKTEASNPALMRYLESLMVDAGYDLKQFLRVLMNSQTFQREATQHEMPRDQKYFFQGPVLRRMTGEQVWDSMLTFVVPSLDKTLSKPDTRADFVYDRYEQLVNMGPDELREQVQKQKLRFTDPQKYREMQAQQRRATQRQRQQKAGMVGEKARELYREYSRAMRAKDQQKIAAITAQLQQLGLDPVRRRVRQPRGNRRADARTALLRASEVQHPAPDSHFLRKFGQSDREQIQASHTEANVPQVLALLNGFVEQQVLSFPSAELMRDIYAAGSSREKIRAAFLGILSREPRGRELAIWEHEMDQDGRKVIKDLVWTLVNSHEFRFIQ